MNSGSKSMFFKLCTAVFSAFFLIIFVLELKHGRVYFEEPRNYILIPEVIIAGGLMLFGFYEVFQEWRKGEWFWAQ